MALGGLLLVALVLLWLWALYDVITVEPSQARHLPKILWIIVVIIFIPPAPLGAVLWVLLGRPRQPTATTSGRPAAPRRVRRAPEPEPDADRHAQRVVTDRRSAELDRMLEEWERTRRDESTPDT
jgi:hypothetical protein